MNEQHPISGIMGITMDKLKEMVDVNTIIGDLRFCVRRIRSSRQAAERPIRRRLRRRRFNTASRISDNFRRKRQAASDVCKRFYS